MASIVTADGPPSTSRSVAVRSTAARVRATRGSTDPHITGDACLTRDSDSLFTKQYDTVLYW